MAAVLNQYGVLKHSKEIRGQHRYRHGKIKPYVDRRKNTNTKHTTGKKFEVISDQNDKVGVRKMIF